MPPLFIYAVALFLAIATDPRSGFAQGSDFVPKLNREYAIARGRYVNAESLPGDAPSYNWHLVSLESASRLATIRRISAPSFFIYEKNSLYAGMPGWEFAEYPAGDLQRRILIGRKGGYLQETKVPLVEMVLDVSKLNRPSTFQFFGREYAVAIEGSRDAECEKAFELFDCVSSYSLVMSAGKRRQPVIERSRQVLDVQSVWITDLDGDRSPDLLTPFENSPTAFDMALFLSGESDPDALLKMVAHYKPCAC